ncbi:MAG TPA: serine hydrolase domain-containing protein [Candidatus Sulfotelmatobacter sp.]|nr:serine hydrolase domain-containing protein [Candidatus Sulfotelmatobacter sp.]
MDPVQLQPAVDVVARQVAAGDLPAALLAVADHEGLVRVGAFAPGRERITPLSHFMIASMTKPIMACAVMRLVEAGDLDLDLPVQRYLPEFAPLPAERGAPGGETITARDILRHTSGLLEDWRRMSRERPDAAHTYRDLAIEPLEYTPGTRHHYTSNSWFVLGELVRRLSGRPYPVFLQDEVLEPLGMTSTGFGRPASDRAPIHGFGPNAFVSPLYLAAFMRLQHPAGGLWSTADDLVRFGRAMLQGGALDGVRILTPESVAEMTREQTTGLPDLEEPGHAAHYGLGWNVPGGRPGKPGSAAAFEHGGSTGGRLWVDPAHDLVIVHLANRWLSEARYSYAVIDAVYGALGLPRSMGTATMEPHSVHDPS